MSRVKRVLRGALRVCKWLLITVVVLIVALVLFLQTDIARNLVRGYAEDKLDDMVDGEVRIGALEGNLLGKFSLRDISVKDASQQEVLRIGTIEVEYGLWDLIGKHAEVERLHVADVKVHARVDENGELNLAGLLASDDDEDDDDEDDGDEAPSAPGFSVAVRDLWLTRAEVSLEVFGEPRRVLRDLELKASVRYDGAGVRVAVDQLRSAVDPGDGGAPIDMAVSVFAQQHLAGALSIAELELSADEARVRVPVAGIDAEDGLAHGILLARVPRSLVDRVAPDSGLRADIDTVFVFSRAGLESPFELSSMGAAGDARLALAATVAPEAPFVRVSADVHGADLATLLVDGPPTHGAAHIELAGGGASLEDAAAVVTVTGRGGTDDIEIADAHGVAVLGAGRVAFMARADVPTGDLQAVGIADLRGDEPRLQIRYRGDVGRVEKLLGPESPARGRASVRGTLAGTLEDLRTRGRGTARNVRYEETRVPSARFSFDLSGLPERPSGTMSFAARGVTVGEDRMGRVSGRARVRDHGKRISVSVRSRDPSATISVRANAEVRLDGETIEVALGGYGLDSRGLGAAGKGGRVSVEDGQTRLRGIELVSKAGKLSIDGVVGEDRIDVRVVGKRIDLAELSRALGIEPRLRGVVDVSGTLDQRGRRVKATGTARARGVGAEGMKPRVDGDLAVSLDGGVLRISGTTSSRELGQGRLGLAVRAPRDPMVADGWLARSERDVESATLVLEDANLAALPLEAPDMPNGGRVNLDLSLAAGARTGRLAVTGKRVTFPRVRGTLAPSLIVDLHGPRLEVTAEGVTSEKERARVTVVARAPGRLGDVDAWARHGRRVIERVDVRAGPVSLTRLAELGAPPSRTPGSVRLSASLGAGLESASSELALRSRGRGRTTETVLRLNSTHRPHDVDGSLTLLISGVPYLTGSASVAAGIRELESGELEAFSTAKARADLTATTLPLRLIGDLIDADERLVGAISGTGSLRGTLEDPVVVVTINGDGTGTEKVRFASLSAGFRNARGRIVAEVLGEQRGGGRLEAALSAGTVPGDAVDGSLVARSFDLGFLKGVLPDLGISGEVEADIGVTGSFEKPVVNGTASIRDGGVRPGPPLRILDRLDAKVAISPTEVTLDASARAGQGALTLVGRAGMRDLEPADLELTLRMADLPVDAGGQLVSVETETVVTGKRVGDVWRLVTRIGDTAVGLPERDSRYLHEMGDMDDVVFIDPGKPRAVRKKPARRAAPAGPRTPSGIRVAIDAPSTITVRGQEAKAVVTVKLSYDDTGAEPSIRGTVRTESGWLEIFGRRYQIERAIASFDGSPDPQLNVRLVHEFSTMSLFIDVRGTGEEPELRLSSDPAIYDDAQLLSFVLGASPDDTDSGERKLSDRAVGIASSLVTDQVQSLVRDVLPIDVLRIELADDSSNPARMTVGKWLSNRLFVAYRHRFEADESENSGEATLEYRFLKRWFIEAFFGDRGVGAADVVWLKRF